ncbi:hypothetical protein FVD69_13460 [Enterococcus faecium]|nr:hypothetical protein [Enterococcus faecium]
MSVFELPTVTLIPNGIHHPPIEDGRLLPNSVKCIICKNFYFPFRNRFHLPFFSRESLKLL